VHLKVATNIAFFFLESDLFQFLLRKNQLPGSRDFPGNIICIYAFPGMTKWLSRGNTSHAQINAKTGQKIFVVQKHT
jgi:hypothetical protein